MLGARKTENWTDAEAPAPAEPPVVAESWPDAAPPSPGRAAIAAVLALLGIGWIAVLIWGGATGAAEARALAGDIALACAPLALIAILFVALRGGNALRFSGNADALDTQVRRLDRTLASLGRRLAEDRAALAGHARHIAAVGAEASGRLAEASATMQADAGLLAAERQALEYAAAAARADLAAMLEGMPRLDDQARAVARTLHDAGGAADTRVQALGEALALIARRGREVDEQAGGAARHLAERLGQLDTAAAAAAGTVGSAAADMTRAVDAALVHAADMLERGRAGIDAQGAAMRALIEQARSTLDQTGSETGEAIATRLAALTATVDIIGQRLATQDAAARDLIGGLNAGLRAIEGRFADLGETGTAEGARLAATVQSIAAYAEQVREGLVVGGDAADVLVARATALAERLEAPARQLHETLPDALGRFDQQARRSLAVLADAAPHVARLDEGTAAVAGRVEGMAAALAAQVEASNALVAEIDCQLGGATDTARALDAAIGEAGAHATRVAEGSTVDLIDAMVRVRETAAQAAERAREAIAAVIPDSAGALARAGEAALGDSVARVVEGQVGRLEAVAEAATASAQRAADRLSAQMLQLAQVTAAVEERIDTAQGQAEAAERESFPRRAAHLIDALNSAAIDVAKIMSNEVTDTVWAAYLKGDRGVFTRRAVKLLDGGEAREIVRHYGDDAEFRDQVNRYVHDFEALLRPILASRDGAPLAVTLLGSDMGKLYVALAQAISRLRG